MNHGLSDTLATDDTREAPHKSTPTIGIITLRFVTLLTMIVALFVWAWSR